MPQGEKSKHTEKRVQTEQSGANHEPRAVSKKETEGRARASGNGRASAKKSGASRAKQGPASARTGNAGSSIGPAKRRASRRKASSRTLDEQRPSEVAREMSETVKREGRSDGAGSVQCPPVMTMPERATPPMTQPIRRRQSLLRRGIDFLFGGGGIFRRIRTILAPAS